MLTSTSHATAPTQAGPWVRTPTSEVGLAEDFGGDHLPKPTAPDIYLYFFYEDSSPYQVLLTSFLSNKCVAREIGE